MQKFTAGNHEIVLKRIRDIPSLPEVVTRILEVIQEPQTPASEIARLISYDPGLTSRVLRMVNSAAYGFQRQISSIQHGIMILGFNTVRGLVLSASILKMFEGQGGRGGLDHRLFWEHSLGTAMAGRILAHHLKVEHGDDAFSAGMLHDIGKVVLDVYFGADYRPVIEWGYRQPAGWHGNAFMEKEQELLGGISHAEIGSYLASKWKLPVTITEVVQHHHHPQQAEHCEALVSMIALANEIAVVLYEKNGIYTPDSFSESLLARFNLEEGDISHFMGELKEQMASADELLHSIAQ